MSIKILLKPRFNGWSVHSLYSDVIENPPNGFKIYYQKPNEKSQLYSIDNKAANPVIKQLVYHLKPIPYIIAQRFQKFDHSNCDLIYASQHVLFNEKLPWITDLEFANAFAAFGNLSIIKNIVKKQFETNNCKFIIPWSEWSKDTLIQSIDCKKILDKIKVIHYTVKPKNFIREKHEGVNFLFVGSSNPMNIQNIQFKNLRETIIAFDNISKKYDNVNLTIRSYLSQDLKQITDKNPKINVIDSVLSKEQLYELYINADIFVLPAHETCGISLFDAMSFELPVIAMNVYDIPEAITHMKNGILIDGHKDMKYYTKTNMPYDYSFKFVSDMKKYSNHIISQLEDYFVKLIEDSSLRKKLAKEARQTIECGKLSFGKRNIELNGIFESAIK